MDKYKLEAPARERLAAKFTRWRFGLVFPVNGIEYGAVQLGSCVFHEATCRVAIACQQSIQIIAVRTGAKLAELPVQRTDFPALAWHPNGKYLAASSDEGIVLWDVAKATQVMLYDHRGHEMQLTFDQHGDYLSDTGKQIKQLQVGPMCSVRFSPDGRWLATSPKGIQVWRTKDWTCGLEIVADGATASGLLFNFSPDSSTLAVLQPDNVIRLFDLQSGHEIGQLFEPRMASASAFTFSHDATMLLTLSDQDPGAVRIWNLAVLRQELAERQLDWKRPK